MRKQVSFTWLFLLIFWTLFPIESKAQKKAESLSVEVPSQPTIVALATNIDLPTLIRLAVERNPKLKAVRANWQATIEKYPQVTALPDPMLMYSYFVRNVETRVGPQRHRLGFS